MKTHTSIMLLIPTVLFGSSLLFGQPPTNLCIKDSPTLDHVGYNNCNMKTNGELMTIQYNVPHQGIIFDVGANKGEWSKHVLRLHPNVTIYAFEPLSFLCDELKNLFNKQSVSVVATAISDEIATKQFTFYKKESALSSLYDRQILSALPHETIEVSTITLDAFCQQNGITSIDFLKIDTEGNEYNVLRGAINLLSVQKIKSIQFEYGGTYQDAKITLHQIYELLQSYDYEIYRITEKNFISIPYWRSNLENFQYSNYLAVPKPPRLSKNNLAD